MGRERTQQLAAAPAQALERPLVVAPCAFELARELGVAGRAQPRRVLCVGGTSDLADEPLEALSQPAALRAGRTAPA